jgi:hypothetical protein
VYTAVVGGYEQLGEQPVAATSDLPFICFTDDPTLTSESWEVRVVPPAFPRDSVRSARKLKITGHPDLDAYDETLWIDNRVSLRVPPEQILDSWLADTDLGLPTHSYRETILDEFQAVVEGGFDDPARVSEQLLHYSQNYPEVLDDRPVWTAILARRNTPEVRRTMLAWYEHVLRYSRRDQLSIRAALAATGLPHHVADIDNIESPLHFWLPFAAVDRRAGGAATGWKDAMMPPLLRVRQLDDEVARLESQLAGLPALAEERDDLLVSLEVREALIDDLERVVSGMRASRSWRLTRPLRNLSFFAARARTR